jgi:hypothetical protein
MCRVSSAQEDTVAESLFREGREAMKGEELDVACPKFAESYRLDPALGTLFNLALCEEKRGRLATAWTKFRQFVDMAPTRDGRASMAWSHIKALEPRLPRLQLMLKGVQTRDALVHLDGVELRGASFGSSIAIDPGSHVVTLTIALQIVRREQFEAHADRVVRIELAAPGGPPDSDKPPVRGVALAAPDIHRESAAASNTRRSTLPSPPTNHDRWRNDALIAGAIGAAGLITSVIVGSFAFAKKDEVDRHCPDGQCDPTGMQAAAEGRTLIVVADLSLAIGLAGGLSCGAFLWQSSLTPSAPGSAGRQQPFGAPPVLISYRGTLP